MKRFFFINKANAESRHRILVDYFSSSGMKKLGGGGWGLLFSEILVQTAEDVLQRRHERWIKTGIIVSQRKSPDIFILSTIRRLLRSWKQPDDCYPPPPPLYPPPPAPPSPSQEPLHLFRTQPLPTGFYQTVYHRHGQTPSITRCPEVVCRAVQLTTLPAIDHTPHWPLLYLQSVLCTHFCA